MLLLKQGLFVPELKGSGATGLAISLLGAMIIQYTTHCMMISSGCRNLEILCFIGMLQVGGIQFPFSVYVTLNSISVVVDLTYVFVQSSAAIGANVFCFILPTYSIKCSFCWSCYMRYWAIQRVWPDSLSFGNIEASKGWRTWKEYQMKKPSKQSREETSNMAATVGITEFIGAEMIEKAIS
ncbi:hypothetical protein HN51_004325 [Arachis hypogaea]